MREGAAGAAAALPSASSSSSSSIRAAAAAAPPPLELELAAAAPPPLGFFPKKEDAMSTAKIRTHALPYPTLPYKLPIYAEPSEGRSASVRLTAGRALGASLLLRRAVFVKD